MMDAVIAGEESGVDPTPEFIRSTLSQVSCAPHEQDRFLCLIRSSEDQLNAIHTDGAWVMEWYREGIGGHLAGFHSGQVPDKSQQNNGFLARLFKGPIPLLGTRISLSEAASMLDNYVSGAETFHGFHWIKI